MSAKENAILIESNSGEDDSDDWAVTSYFK